MSKLTELINEARISDSYWARTTSNFDLHPLVTTLINDGLLPAAPTKVIYEWPHESETGDRTKLAYARDAKAHEANLYTRVSIGRYLRQNWPHLKDHEIRDLVTNYCVTFYNIELLTDLRDMVCAVLFGPESCMKWDSSEMGTSAYEAAEQWYKNREDDNSGWEYDHPYCVYSPRLGWAVAVRRAADGQIVGRAVVNTKEKIFVRTYVLRNDTTAQSSDDDALRIWLESKGFEKVNRWPEGTEFSYYPTRDDTPFMPYLDGGCADDRRVSVQYGKVIRDDEGEYVADCTDGTVSSAEPDGWCDCCGDPIYDTDTGYTARSCGREVIICEHCADHHFVQAYYATRFGAEEELVHKDDLAAVYYGSNRFEWWDENALSEDIVSLDKPVVAGGLECWYAHTDYAVITHDDRAIADIHADERDGVIYHVDDEVETETGVAP